MKLDSLRNLSLARQCLGAAARLALAAAAILWWPTVATAQEPPATRPTIVLVHGAFADASSWNGVARLLLAHGFRVVAVANPLRGVKSDAEGVLRAVHAIDGPVVLVGHSYGGNVITQAAKDEPRVVGLVFVAAFAPDQGESAAALAGRFPGSTLASALASAVPVGNGEKEISIRQDRFAGQFAADVAPDVARLMAVTQRPIVAAALDEPSGPPAWKDLPSWFVYGDADKNIPPAALAFMARRASAKRTVVVRGASHVLMISHPQTVAALIEEAAGSRPIASTRSPEHRSPIFGVAIPAGYRRWELVAPSHRPDLDEIRDVLGNPLALQAYRLGTLPFPDGAVLVKLAWKHVPLKDDPEAFGPGDATTVQVMVKDSRRYAATGGWGFGRFTGGQPASRAEHRTCFACHQALVKDHDWVFTRYAR